MRNSKEVRDWLRNAYIESRYTMSWLRNKRKMEEFDTFLFEKPKSTESMVLDQELLCNLCRQPCNESIAKACKTTAYSIYKPIGTIEVEDALESFCKKLREDKELYYGWQSNIAMQFVDEARRTFDDLVSFDLLHEIANKAAKNFLDLLIKPQEDTDDSK